MVTEIVLWNHVGSSDKLWGVIDYHGRAITFWGRRNHELSFKLLTTDEQDKVEKFAGKKLRDDYRLTSFAELEEATQGFKQHFDHMFSMVVLGDAYRHTDASTIANI